MIQKISFTSAYIFRNNYKSQFPEYYSAVKPVQNVQDNLYLLKKGDDIKIHHGKDGSFSIIVPDYMDDKFEKYCSYEGTQYNKI